MTVFFRAATILITIALFIASSTPSVVHSIPVSLHWAAHFSLYAFIGVICYLGWPRMKPGHVAALVACIGFIHELSEIKTHHHGLEFRDVLIDGLGALLGVMIVHSARKFAG